MKQVDLFTTKQTVHYGSAVSPSLPAWKRVALCGVIYSTSGDTREPPEPCGSSDLANVTCVNCLAAEAAHKAILEAGE